MDFNGCILVQSTKICIRITQVREFINWLIVLTKLSTTLMTEGLLECLDPKGFGYDGTSQMYQHSEDMGLGVPFNIVLCCSSYARNYLNPKLE